MKKLLILGFACLFAFASCQNKNNQPAEEAQAEPQEQVAEEPQLSAEQQAIVTDWQNWANLEEARQTEIINYCKQSYDNGETPVITCKNRQARVDSLMGIWDKLSLDEQKATMELVCKKCKDHGNHEAGTCDHEHEGEHCQE